MAYKYYPFPYRLDKADHYLIWATDFDSDDNPPDKVVTTLPGQVATFQTLDELVAYAERLALTPLENEPEPRRLNLDTVNRWLRVRNRRKLQPINCQIFLDAWNLLADVSATIDGNFDPDRHRTQRVYDKLLWGNNLPSITPEGRSYEPFWPRDEIKLMRKILDQGLKMFRAHVTDSSDA